MISTKVFQSGKVTVFAGESGAGKSYFASGNIVKNAQQQELVVLIDSENADSMKHGYMHWVLIQMKANCLN